MTTTEQNVDLFELANASVAKVKELAVEVPDRRSNMTFATGELTTFPSTWTIHNEDEDKVIDCVGGFDLREGKLVLTEIAAYRQVKGGQDVAERLRAAGHEDKIEWQWVVEMTVNCVGGRLMFGPTSDNLRPLPFYDDPEFQRVTNQVPIMYVKSPFTVPEEVVEQLREIVYRPVDEGGYSFGPAQLGQRRSDAKREQHYHLVAPGRSYVERRSTGMPLQNLTVLPGRPVSQWQTDDKNNKVPEFLDPVSAWQANVETAMVKGRTKLVSSITGFDGRQGDNPLRATAAGLTYVVTEETKSGRKVETPENVYLFPARDAQEQ